MPPRIHSIRTYSNRKNGFALIASLSIMAMLVMIAVALYSMSAVATRSAEITSARTEAQANAKMALMMAIGDLQKYTGADTRVTAPANITADDTIPIEDIDDTIPKLIGAWRSWEGLNHDTTGRPVAPDYTIKAQPSTSGNGRFLTWLISSASEGQNITDPESLAFLTPTP
jgi:type II secretory pathway pseudopilin PulG